MSQDDIWGSGEMTEDADELQREPGEPGEGEEETPAPRETAKQEEKAKGQVARKHGNWRSPFTLIPLGCGVFAILLGAVWLYLHLSQPQEPASLLSAQRPVPVGQAKKTVEPALMLDDQMESMPARAQTVPSGTLTAAPDASGVQQELDSLRDEVQSLAGLVAEVRQNARETATMMRGEGMASISDADLQALLASNSALQQQVENEQTERDKSNQELAEAQDEIERLQSQNEVLSRKLSESQRQYAALQAQRKEGTGDKGAAPVKPQPRPAPKSMPAGRPVNAEAVPPRVPFEVQGLTQTFAVIKTVDGYKKWDVGTTIDGVTLKGINLGKQSLDTSAGPLKLHGAR